MSEPLRPQAALETAVRDAVRAQLHYGPGDCERTFDGRPHARAGLWFVAVWGTGQRDSDSRTALDERFHVNVTVTGQSRLPADRLVDLRDELEGRVNDIRRLVHGDSWDQPIRAAANKLAGLGDHPTGRSVGFCEGLMFMGLDAVQQQGPDWFGAGMGGGKASGLAQTARFGRARLVQGIKTAR